MPLLLLRLRVVVASGCSWGAHAVHTETAVRAGGVFFSFVLLLAVCGGRVHCKQQFPFRPVSSQSTGVECETQRHSGNRDNRGNRADTAAQRDRTTTTAEHRVRCSYDGGTCNVSSTLQLNNKNDTTRYATGHTNRMKLSTVMAADFTRSYFESLRLQQRQQPANHCDLPDRTDRLFNMQPMCTRIHGPE